MAIKDWKKGRHLKNYSTEIAFKKKISPVFLKFYKQDKNGYHEIIGSKMNNKYYVFTDEKEKDFKTKSQALAYAKAYMRRN